MMKLLEAALWIVPLVGAGGLIALMIFAPAAAAVVITVGKDLLGAILSTRAGCAILAALTFGGAGELHGRMGERAACDGRIAVLQKAAEDAAQKRDAEIAAAIEQKYAAQMSALDGESKSLKAQVDDYERKILAAAGAGQCVLGVDALRLRQPHKK